jgi:DNA ligase-1
VSQKTYPTLYARTHTGSIQLWWMEQEGSSFRSVSGREGGAKVISAWSKAEAKNIGKTNATTDEEQAAAEIQSKYDKQLKSGGYWKDKKDIDKTRFFEVMLAKSYGDYKDEIDWSKGVGVQIKYNGGRVIATKNGLFTRKGEKYISIPHIEEALKPFFVKFPDAVLDGEGFNYDRREKLNEIMSLINKKVHVAPDDLVKSKEMIRYYIYDGFGFPAAKDGPVVEQTAGYEARKAAIDNAFFAPCFKDRYEDVIGFVPTTIVKSEKELEDLYQTFLIEKHEGAILRILDKPYENKRSKFLLKYKPVDDDEFIIVGVNEGNGKFAGRVATVTCKTIGKIFADNTMTFDATFKGTQAQAITALKDAKSLLGKTVTIYYNGFTGYGKPNYAQFDWNNYNKGN